MRLAAMFDFWLWSSWLTIKKLTPKINLFYRPSGGQIAKNLVGGCFLKRKKFTWTCCQTNYFYFTNTSKWYFILKMDRFEVSSFIPITFIVWEQAQPLLKKTPPPGFWRFDLLKAYRKDFFWVSHFLLLANRSRAKNPTWLPSAWFGQTNFFCRGDKSKILFSSMGFWYPGSSKK